MVGGGAVGSHAALKAAVLRHSVLLVDRGPAFARVRQARRIANIPGSPGISGDDLLARLRKDLESFAKLAGERLVTVVDGAEAIAARREGDVFRVTLREGDRTRDVRGRVLVLATGMVDRKPGIEAFLEHGHDTIALLHHSDVGYCVLCEGWDLRDRDVGIVGCSPDSLQIAADVATHFGGRVTILADGGAAPPDATPRGARVEARPIARYEPTARGVRVRFEDGDAAEFDRVLFTLGCYRVNNDLARMLGAATTEEGYVVTDESSEALDADRRPIEGLFVVGDARAGRWKQIVVGWGDAETAVITAYAKRLP